MLEVVVRWIAFLLARLLRRSPEIRHEATVLVTMHRAQGGVGRSARASPDCGPKLMLGTRPSDRAAPLDRRHARDRAPHRLSASARHGDADG